MNCEMQLVVPVKKKRLVYLEMMRVVAAFFVIFNHTGGCGFFLFSERSPDSLMFWVYLVISVFCKVSVPLFFSISGALMLARNDEPLKKLGKRILKMAAILCAAMALYYYVESCKMREEVRFVDLIQIIYTQRHLDGSEAFTHLWYMYAYIAFLIALPFLRALVQKLESKYFYYLIMLAVLFNAVIPIGEYILSRGTVHLNQSVIPWTVQQIILYPSVGYFLEHRINITSQKKRLIVLWIVNLTCIAISCYMTYYKGTVDGVLEEDLSQTFFGSFVLINCITIYCSIKCFFSCVRIPQWLERIIISIGKCTFGIYLIHSMVLTSALTNKVWQFMIEAGMNGMVAGLLECVFVMILSYGIIWLIMKIPRVGKVLGG